MFKIISLFGKISNAVALFSPHGNQFCPQSGRVVEWGHEKHKGVLRGSRNDKRIWWVLLPGSRYYQYRSSGEPVWVEESQSTASMGDKWAYKGILLKELEIERIPCYCWFLCLLKLVKADSLSRCLMRWAEEMLPENRKGVTVSLDGKTVRSTGKMDSYDSPLHVITSEPKGRK